MSNASPSPLSATYRRLRLADALNGSWLRLGTDPTSVSAANRWDLGIEPVGDLDDVLAAAGFGRPADDADGDRVLARLVAVARGDELAARVVLQRLLPGIIRIAVRRSRITPGGSQTAFDDLVSTAWLTIRTFPVDRRPSHVAANLLRDIEYQAFVRYVRRRREHPAGTVTDTPLEPLVEVDVDPGRRQEWAEVIEWARRRGVDPAKLDLLARFAFGHSTVEVAKELRCTDRTVRNRRDAAVAAVRATIAA